MVDGESARGSRTDTAPAAHLRSAVTAVGRTVSQLRVPDRTNEITGLTALHLKTGKVTRQLAPFDPIGTVEIRTGHGPEHMATLRNFAINTSGTPATPASPPDRERSPAHRSPGHSTSSDCP
ncbi:hypothetical protein ACWF95_40365 [Streptomyces vinaceus]